MLVELNNACLRVTIDSKGAELQSVLAKDGHEYIWSGDPTVWNGRAPVLFPIVGGIIDDEYTYAGKTYPLAKHGFARLMDFTVEKAEATEAIFLLTATPETKRQYPFNFAFRVIFSLKQNTISVEYRVDNPEERTLYFSFGAHEAYACPGGISNYRLEFEQAAPTERFLVDGNFLNGVSVPVPSQGNILPMQDAFFEEDALIFPNIASKKVRLVRDDLKKNVTVTYPGFDNLLIWTKPGAEYLCIEPWDGIPDAVGADKALETKTGMVALAAGESYGLTHTIIFEDEVE